ncbi:MAG TPA: glycosyltransferase family 2 protein [Arachnia sp.]|nr:glycosyltransferase family 2 protein [Arachnia sp.]HMT85211.1 glycosyltransferase family 2 protein [Arachnia sp.]
MPGPTPSFPHLSETEIVLVSYKSRHHVEELLSTWPADLAVAVVDNAGNSDGLRELAGERATVRYLDGGSQGFGRAANLGAFSTTKRFVVFVNPDCRPTPAHLESLIAGLAGDPGSASHAATMTGSDGAIEAGVGGWEPSVRRLAVYALGLGNRFRRAGFFAAPRPGERCEVDWTTGACMAVRAAQFADLGGFDETFYVYAEDVSFGRQARLAGLRCLLREDVLVPHGAGGSGAPSREMLRLRGASFAGYLTRYHRRAALLMRAEMILGAVLRGLAGLLRGRRQLVAEQWAFIVGTATMKAYVGGQEVAARRFAEVTRSARP